MFGNILFNLIIAHIISDFYLQWGVSCQNKLKSYIRGWASWLHAFIVFILSWAAVWNPQAWWLALMIATCHFLTDWLKSILSKNEKHELPIFIGDQILHLGTLSLMAFVWLSNNDNWQQFDWLTNWITNHPLRINTFIAILLALKPTNTLLLYILKSCKVNTNQQNSDNSETFHSGALIGYLERVLTLLFVILAQYEALGFLIAAKSILRFNATSSGDKKSEYVLTGTLLSLTIALCLGLMAVRLFFTSTL